MASWRSGVDGRLSVFVALLALSAVIRVGVLVDHGFDPDESQHLHAAWRVGQGQVPFLDFWEHHAPLLHYLLAPLTHWFADSPSVYLAGRVVMTLAAGVALWLSYHLGRRLSRGAALAGLALLALMPQFIENTTEIRPDVPALVAWLATLLALVTWRERGASGWLWIAGLAQGVGLLFTPKAGYWALGAALAVLIAGWDSGSGGPARALAWLSRFVGGACGPPVLLLAGLWLTGGLRALAGLFEHVVIENLRFVDFTGAWPVQSEDLAFLLLALTGVGLAVREHGAGVVRHPLHGMLLLPMVVISAILLFPATPAVYRQAWLPVLPIGALYAGTALTALVARARADKGAGARALVVLALVGGLVVPAGQAIYQAVRDQTWSQIEAMRLLLRHTCPGEPVVDGTALYVFRPSAYRYGVLITGVRYWIAQGVIPEERIEEDLRRARARVAYPDRRLRALVGPVADFLARYYVASADGLLIAGAAIPVREGSRSGRARVDLLVPGVYRFTADPGIEVTMDRGPLRRGWVELDAGPHELTWTGPPGRIGLVAATCPERRALAASGPGSNRLTAPSGGD